MESLCREQWTPVLFCTYNHVILQNVHILYIYPRDIYTYVYLICYNLYGSLSWVIFSLVDVNHYHYLYKGIIYVMQTHCSRQTFFLMQKLLYGSKQTKNGTLSEGNESFKKCLLFHFCNHWVRNKYLYRQTFEGIRLWNNLNWKLWSNMSSLFAQMLNVIGIASNYPLSSVCVISTIVRQYVHSLFLSQAIC